MSMPTLSICIATYKRAAFLGETLDSLLRQWCPGVELVVVDGASPDGTADLMEQYVVRHPHIVYRREQTNSGIDIDYDKAVRYAAGKYCWLMSDDDLAVPGAVQRVLKELHAHEPDVLVLNVEVRNKDLSVQLNPRRLEVREDKVYHASDAEQFFAETCLHLSFIACAVVLRELWLARDRERYFGTLFIHIGVLFQERLQKAVVVAQPQVIMRDGNAMWTARSFDIWMRRWPELVWSFDGFSEAARQLVTARHPAHSAKMLLWLRALGAYGDEEYKQHLAASPTRPRLAARIARLPVGAVNSLVGIYCALGPRATSRMKLYALVNARRASWLTKFIAGRRNIPRES